RVVVEERLDVAPERAVGGLRVAILAVGGVVDEALGRARDLLPMAEATHGEQSIESGLIELPSQARMALDEALLGGFEDASRRSPVAVADVRHALEHVDLREEFVVAALARAAL